MPQSRRSSLNQIFRRDSIKWATLTSLLSIAIFVPAIIGLVKVETERRVASEARTTAQAYRPMILSGNARDAEIAIRRMLELGPDESVKVLDPNYRPVYDEGQTLNRNRCEPAGGSCWNSTFTRLNSFAGIYFDEAKTSQFGYLLIQSKPKIDLFVVLWMLGGLALLQLLFIFGYTSGVRRIGAMMTQEMRKLLESLSQPSQEKDGLPSITEFGDVQQAVSDLSMQMKKLEGRSVSEDTMRQVAHDIRSPLTALKMALHRTDGISVEAARLLEQACSRIENIAKDILVPGQQLSTDSETDLYQVLETLIAEKRTEYLSKPIHIGLNNSDQFKNLSVDDVVGLQRVISNLINNAVDAAPSGKVSLSGYRKASFLVLTIADNGTGISEEMIQKISEKGYTTKSDGNGLGLFHAKQFADKLGGSLSVMSQIGVGTQISLKLPVRQMFPAEKLLAVP